MFVLSHFKEFLCNWALNNTQQYFPIVAAQYNILGLRQAHSFIQYGLEDIIFSGIINVSQKCKREN